MALLPAAVRGDLLLLILSLDFIDFHCDRPKRLRAGTSGCNCIRPTSIYIEPHFHIDFFLYKIFEKYQSNKSRRHNLISRLRFCKRNPPLEQHAFSNKHEHSHLYLQAALLDVTTLHQLIIAGLTTIRYHIITFITTVFTNYVRTNKNKH